MLSYLNSAPPLVQILFAESNRVAGANAFPSRAWERGKMMKNLKIYSLFEQLFKTEPKISTKKWQSLNNSEILYLKALVLARRKVKQFSHSEMLEFEFPLEFYIKIKNEQFCIVVEELWIDEELAHVIIEVEEAGRGNQISCDAIIRAK